MIESLAHTPEMLESAHRQFALQLAAQTCAREDKYDGQSIIRRAVGFYKFLSGDIGGSND